MAQSIHGEESGAVLCRCVHQQAQPGQEQGGLDKMKCFRELRHLLLLWLGEALLLNHLQEPHFLLPDLKEVLQ